MQRHAGVVRRDAGCPCGIGDRFALQFNAANQFGLGGLELFNQGLDAVAGSFLGLWVVQSRFAYGPRVIPHLSRATTANMIHHGISQHLVEPSRELLLVLHLRDIAHRFDEPVLQHVVSVRFAPQARDKEGTKFRPSRKEGM